MDNLTTAIIAAVAGSGATFLLTKASVIARFPARSWLVRRTTRKFQTLRDRYGVKRTRKIVRNWFSTHQGISHLNINDFERAKRTRAQQKPQLRTFSFMNLRQHRFAPRLDDHYIAASIDELCNRGTLVRLRKTSGSQNRRRVLPRTMPTSRADVPEHQILRWKPVRSTGKRGGGKNSEVLHRMPLLENSGWMSRNQIFISVHKRREGKTEPSTGPK